MRQRVSVAAFAGLCLILSRVAGAYSSGQFNTNLARCNTCHSGGQSPRASFAPVERASRTDAGLQITGGLTATLALDVKMLRGKGLGLAIVAGDGLTIEPVREDTRVDRQTIGHTRVLVEPSGRYRVPFRLTGPASTCGRTFVLRASVVAANRNGAPSGDGVAGSTIRLFVDCAATGRNPPASEPPPVK